MAIPLWVPFVGLDFSIDDKVCLGHFTRFLLLLLLFPLLVFIFCYDAYLLCSLSPTYLNASEAPHSF